MLATRLSCSLDNCTYMCFADFLFDRDKLRNLGLLPVLAIKLFEKRSTLALMLLLLSTSV